MNITLDSGGVYELLKYNISVSGHSKKVTTVVGDSNITLGHIAPRHYDVVFIDGNHTYDIAVYDIEHGKKLVPDGGILCGDDLELQMAEVDPEVTLRSRNQDWITDEKAKSDTISGFRLPYMRILATSAFGKSFGR